MIRPDGLKRLPNSVAEALAKALATLPPRRGNRLLLRPVDEDRAPYYDKTDDYNVIWRDQRVGRIHRDLRPYDADKHVPWHWRLNLSDGSLVTGRAATRDEAMAAFRAAWDARTRTVAG